MYNKLSHAGSPVERFHFVNFNNDRSVHQVGGVNSSSKSNWNQQSKLPINFVLDLVFLSQFLQIEEAYLEIAFLTVV